VVSIVDATSIAGDEAFKELTRSEEKFSVGKPLATDARSCKASQKPPAVIGRSLRRFMKTLAGEAAVPILPWNS
jgi:hypothetical protein